MKLKTLPVIVAGYFVAATHADIYISEYLEGSSNNKALEIVNLTGSDITLDDQYSVEIYFNGNTSLGNNIGLNGTLENRQVFVLAHSSADELVLEQSDQNTGALNFNGDDTIILRGPDGVILDVIGLIGTDPGREWGEGDTSTQNNTLLRNISTRAGDTNPVDVFDPSEQWMGSAINSFNDLGKFGEPADDGDAPIVNIGICGDDATLISAIQGNGEASPMAGMDVVVEASVTFVAPGLEGFFLQEEAAQFDDDDATSEGIFVFTGTAPITVSEGQTVRVAGTVSEFFDKTQITPSEISESCGGGEYAAVDLSLPLAEGDSFEAYEGMLINNSQSLTIVNTFNYARFGEVEVANGRTFTPTHLFTPGSGEAIELAASNARNGIIFDDAQNGSPDSLDLNGELSANNSLRTGSTISGVSGVIDFSFRAYRIQPLVAPVVRADERPSSPEVEGDLKIASFNVLNLFNGDGIGGGFPTSRGADDFAEYQLQLAKIANAIVALNADVTGLMELENDGFGPQSAIAQLVDALNERAGESVYDFIRAQGPVGTDQIAVGLVYQGANVSPSGTLQILDESNSIADDQGPLFNTRRNRPAMAQSFIDNDSGESFVVSVNHFKSKGSSCGTGDDSPDQGSCNVTRTRAAQALHVWLESTFSDQAIFIVGDLNSYAKEDPIVELAGAGYVDIARDIDGPEAYSYSFRGEFGSLDYALANSIANPLVTDVLEWHINADEPIALDYNDSLSSTIDKPESFRSDSVFRSSDHDPVIVGFSFASDALPGDVNGDGSLSFDDFFLIYGMLGNRADMAGFNEAADIDANGVISFNDLIALLRIRFKL